MNPLTILIITVVMFLVQRAVYKAVLPLQMQYFLAYYPLLGVLANLGASSLILVFTGVASMVGLGNLGASVIFGIYLNVIRRRLDLRSVRKGLFPYIIPASELKNGDDSC